MTPKEKVLSLIHHEDPQMQAQGVQLLLSLKSQMALEDRAFLFAQAISFPCTSEYYSDEHSDDYFEFDWDRDTSYRYFLKSALNETLEHHPKLQITELQEDFLFAPHEHFYEKVECDVIMLLHSKALCVYAVVHLWASGDTIITDFSSSFSGFTSLSSALEHMLTHFSVEPRPELIGQLEPSSLNTSPKLERCLSHMFCKHLPLLMANPPQDVPEIHELLNPLQKAFSNPHTILSGLKILLEESSDE